MLSIRPATPEDAAWIGANLREADETEVRTSSGGDPKDVLLRSLELSRECYVASWRDSEQPCVIFGVSDDPTCEGLGIVWLLATDEIRKSPLEVFKLAHGWLEYMSRHYPLGLHNIADERNTLHIRWCLLMGFKPLDAVEHRGHRFIHIYRETKNV